MSTGTGYAVRRYYKTHGYGLYGWNANTTDHTDEAAALAAFNAPFTGREFRAELLQWQGTRLATIDRRVKRK